MTGPDRIVLHLGAHKTASTHLQQALRRSRPALAAAGIVALVPDDLRKDGLRLQDWLGLTGEDPAHEQALRAAFARPARRLVLSEENLPGMVPGPALGAEGCLYPQAGARLAKLARVLPAGARVTLALALREGAGFLASCHVQGLMAGRLAPYAQVFGGIDPAALDWAGLAARLLAARPEAELVVWNFADWPAIAPAVARALLGAGAPGLDWPRAPAHPGLSAPAVAALLAEAPPDAETARARARALRAALPKSAGHPPFDPWPAGVGAGIRARAAAALARDLDRIAALPGARVLRPAPAGASGGTGGGTGGTAPG